MTVALCMFALWAWGGWISWKGIENGNVLSFPRKYAKV